MNRWHSLTPEETSDAPPPKGSGRGEVDTRRRGRKEGIPLLLFLLLLPPSNIDICSFPFSLFGKGIINVSDFFFLGRGERGGDPFALPPPPPSHMQRPRFIDSAGSLWRRDLFSPNCFPHLNFSYNFLQIAYL